MDTRIFLGLKWPGLGIDHPPPSCAKVKERVELYLYSPSGPLWPVLGWTLPLHWCTIAIISVGKWSSAGRSFLERCVVLLLMLYQLNNPFKCVFMSREQGKSHSDKPGGRSACGKTVTCIFGQETLFLRCLHDGPNTQQQVIYISRAKHFCKLLVNSLPLRKKFVSYSIPFTIKNIKYYTLPLFLKALH